MTSTGDSPDVVEVNKLCVSLAGRQVLNEISFSVPRGAALALVGESGSGKTVTARVLTGLLGRIGGVVTNGTVEFEGIDLTKQTEADWRRIHGHRIGLVPQASLSSLNPVIRVGNQLRETVRLLDPDADATARSIELLEMVRLPRPADTLRRYPHELSGGMRQRVMIALALAGRPEFIVADEPTTALDVVVQKGILLLLNDLRRQTGMTLMLIAHDLAVVREVAEQIAVMRNGVLVEQGSAERILERPEHAYTQALMAARPEATKKGQALAVLDRTTGELKQAVTPKFVAPVDPKLLISLREVRVRYAKTTKDAVAAMDLDIRESDAVGIVGESGSGKTTLGRVIIGALQPTTGSVLIEGRPWNGATRKSSLRKDVQMIFQDPYGSLTPWRTPRQVVAEVVRRWNHLSRVEASRRAEQILIEVGLPPEAMDKLPGKLSGGQCQRVGIARALACEPRVLVADEPTSALDVSVQAQILNLLTRLRASRGLALVLISHDLTVVRHMTDTAIVMRDGVVVERATSAQLFSAPTHEYTRGLVDATPVLLKTPGAAMGSIP